MNILLFEGIASSGKTTIERVLANALPDSVLITEGDTLMPLIDNRDPQLAVEHVRQLLERFREVRAPYLLIDRLHFTHAFRTGADLTLFSEVEDELQKLGSVLVVLLTMHPSAIKERIQETILRRGDGWKKGAEGSIDEKVAYYTEQQKTLTSLVSVSRLPTITIDTTQKTWDDYAKSVIHRLED